MEGLAALWYRCAAKLDVAGQLIQPSELSETVNEVLSPIGAAVAIYLADREQVALRRVPVAPGPIAGMQEPSTEANPGTLSVAGTLAGYAYRMVRPTPRPHTDDRIWMPIVDGVERLGVLDVRLPAGMPARDPGVLEGLRVFAIAVGHVLVAKMAYGDSLRRARRSQPMSVGAELLWRMLPPLTFATRDMALAGVIEPCYRAGGDAFDYAVDHDVAYVSIFDAVGHDLDASLITTLALAATRAARIRGDDLIGIARATDDALTSEFDDLRYATAVLAQLQMRSGVLRYVTAGHPGTILIRHRHGVITLDGARSTPLGIAGPREHIAEEALEPGDRLVFYTDGVTEARNDAGVPFGTERLVDLAERYANDGLPAPEIARRIGRAVVDYQRGALHDDATLLLLDWNRGAGTGVTA